jgi:hypothetical protein
MRRFLPLFISIVVFTLLQPLSANTKTCIMDKQVYSIVESEAASFASIVPEDETKFTLYISDGILFIKYAKPQELVNGEAVIYNLLGKEVARKKLVNSDVNEISIPIQNTCYIVRINYSGKVFTQKVIPSSN